MNLLEIGGGLLHAQKGKKEMKRQNRMRFCERSSDSIVYLAVHFRDKLI
jgi:hypothetical protein